MEFIGLTGFVLNFFNACIKLCKRAIFLFFFDFAVFFKFFCQNRRSYNYQDQFGDGFNRGKLNMEFTKCAG